MCYKTKNLYHTDIFTPPQFKRIENVIVDNIYPLSPYVVNAANSDRFGQIIVPSSFEFSYCDIIEIETYKDSTDIKFLIRLEYDKINDLCIVILCDRLGNVRIKTVWLNEKTDKHKTLDKTKYSKN